MLFQKQTPLGPTLLRLQMAVNCRHHITVVPQGEELYEL